MPICLDKSFLWEEVGREMSERREGRGSVCVCVCEPCVLMSEERRVTACSCHKL